MISSMTGFAREAGSLGSGSWAWEIKSVNGRSLYIRVRVPPGFDAIGEDARKLLASSLVRGSVQAGLTIQRVETRRTSVKINTDMLLSLGNAINALPADLPFKPATMDGLLQIRGVVEVDEPDEHAIGADLQAVLRVAASDATKALTVARRQEGVVLGDVLNGQLTQMREFVALIESHPERTTDAVRTRLQGQVAALITGHATLDSSRLYQEAALLATRADVREELDRLQAHIDAATELLARGGAIGRKLDFLAQEFGREASTLCAKASHVDLSRAGLELRAIVDQFREQTQNVE